MQTIQYRGYVIEESDSLPISESAAGRIEYSRIVKVNGEHEVWNGIEWELLSSVKRAQQLIDSGKIRIRNQALRQYVVDYSAAYEPDYRGTRGNDVNAVCQDAHGPSWLVALKLI